jgi:hypothetical protein
LFHIGWILPNAKANKYLVYNTVRFHQNQKLHFYSANTDLTGFGNEPTLMFSPKYGGIDGDIIVKSSYSRSVCVDSLNYNPDDTLIRVVMTTEGVGQIGKTK